MFTKILIANRGEIACRVIKTARKMGIKTVAVYSDADIDALHKEMADEAVHIGPAPAAQSYLLIDKVIAAAKETGAEAVHPGYGFLSENPAFAEALAAAGIAFIGPNIEAIRAMGDKIESKKFAAKAKVSTVPGDLGVIKDAADAVKIADKIGYPVMIKASAGGGGKGMRIARSASEVEQGFNSSKSEAKSSFGDDRVFIEKFIENPRHIEIQVLGDKHGSVVHLFERECSIQRRNQKVIEEAPSPFLDAATREAMGAQAVALAQAVNYESAGTVEFIVDQDRNFYFLEMNTRLQVEHPVTELITGVDLVEQMIRVAAGEPLPFNQSQLGITGWALESRVYAEDPVRNFLPSIGRLVRYRPPAEGTQGGLTVRNDTGVYEGGEISIYYDPMIAKLVTHGPTRDAAIGEMSRALDAFYIDGIRHNIPFLSAIMQHPRWRSGALSTGFIAEEFPDGFAPRGPEGAELETLACVAAAIDHLSNERRRRISGQMQGDPVRFTDLRVVELGKERVALRVSGTLGEPVTVSFGAGNGSARSVTAVSDWWPGDPVWHGTLGGDAISVQVRPILNGVELTYAGIVVPVRVYTEREAELAALMPEKKLADTSKTLRCPMPGLVRAIDVIVGQEVKVGETLCTVEAMKMENILRAERDATVKSIKAKPGDSLAVDAVIMEFV
ncbi:MULTISPECIES: acetyl/propionyl/methylcrotonyl-CoA carboxylase subunit alpha [Rhodomicrobium]|uniref:acetyl-CoA carboxylase biotin carboxylase subunit n=1 Tax=Rhodomicrobium TaxID=1068 RepID=UPI000B4BAB4F|nr:MULTISPECIES: acetyl/propionyl/methylcrotonyl-CoA carboxylase subunit alpha [Rhodomicrobium]